MSDTATGAVKINFVLLGELLHVAVLLQICCRRVLYVVVDREHGLATVLDLIAAERRAIFLQNGSRVVMCHTVLWLK